ncbi:putative tRNA splicing endonuclease subunit (Sen54) [Penicillium brasilianum]|uniref:Putative tRNA splicing endonuclease subunit (Sen54) n=1 Tax=Penicillium brasilianum TaxID=104259 RepID=A0A1S9RSP0_PENBI|nr:putative tRNA splicing endonuclease subunit (Sen54) [Penicillium brasilianum]
MADADEDAVRGTTVEASQIEVDLSDETQDFRLLNHLNFLTDTSSSSLPRRGEKDFEPNPTEFQADVLSASRQAMHNALAHPRLHNPKNRVIAIYAPEGPPPPPPVTPGQEPGKTGGRGASVSPDACVYVPSPKGQYFKTMGQADRKGVMWLLPEEALYLLERGSLDIRWPTSITGVTVEEGTEEELSIPMSLQAAYACLIGRGGLTLERFTVFSSLKRIGYTISRAPGWDDSATVEDSADETSSNAYTQPVKRGAGLAGILGSIFNWINDPKSTSSTAAGPVIGYGIHRNYSDIYKKLAQIPWYDPTLLHHRNPLSTKAPYRVILHVFKPSTPIKKSALPHPDFRIAVINTRESTTIPTLPELSALLESTPLDPPKGEKMERQMYMRLRHGYRNVILAVVDQGVTSFLRVADVAFGRERLYESVGGPLGPKKGGNFRKKKR